MFLWEIWGSQSSVAEDQVFWHVKILVQEVYLTPKMKALRSFKIIRICWCNYIVSCCTILEPSMSYFIYLNVVYLVMLTVTWLLNSIKWTHKLITCSFICVLNKWSFYYERSCGCCKSSIGTVVITAAVESKTEWIYVVADIYIGASLLKRNEIVCPSCM